MTENNKTYSIFEYSEEEDEEDAEDEDNECVKMSTHPKEKTTKCSFNTENLSLVDIEEKTRKFKEKHPDESPGAGVFQYASVLETEIKEKEKEIEACKNNQHCTMLMNHVNVNEIKAQDHEHNELADKCNRSNVKYENFHPEAMEKGIKLADCANEVEDKLEQVEDKCNKLIHDYNELFDLNKELKDKYEKEKKAKEKKGASKKLISA